MSIVKSIRIQNFKSLEDVTIDLSQLTFLFGANSSGKSSFLKALMFLEKNLFPLQYPKSRYKLGNDIDLESFEKIVTKGDMKRNLEYEFLLSGEFGFPVERIIFDQKSQHKGSNDFFNRLETLAYEIAKVSGQEYVVQEFNVIYNIVFEHFLFEIDQESKETRLEKDKCICRVKISDKISQMNYEFKLGKRTDEMKIVDYETFYHDQKPFIQDVFASKVGFVRKRDYFSEYKDYVSQRKNLFTGIDFDDIHTDAFNRNRNGEVLSEEWEALSNEDKDENFVQFMKFFYLAVRVIPTALEQFLSLIHMPITREPLKKFYELHNDTIDQNEYYGFLPSLLYYSQDNRTKGTLGYSQKEVDFREKLDQHFAQIYLHAEKEKEGKEYIVLDENEMVLRRGFVFNDLCLMVNYWLNRFEFDIYYSTDKNSKICEFYLTGDNELQIGFTQASSGLIQLFPIIVSCCILLRNLEKFDKFLKQNIEATLNFPYKGFLSKAIPIEPLFFTLSMEQPELHLHPRLQSKLAILLSRTIKFINDDATILIETHSEHLIRKLQVLIAKGELAREKVGVWYFKKVNGVTKVEKMEIDENGLFKKDWPDGFFDDSIELTMELFEAVRKRKN